MANTKAAIKQADAKRIFKAGREAGFPEVKIIVHPDGRIEGVGYENPLRARTDASNSWDDVLK
ncbi:hypothetical protein OK142_19725 [Agrobacterium sp. BT-220-3]|nr:hypothetical protein [Agrobacterium sp. BT-220-3]